MGGWVGGWVGGWGHADTHRQRQALACPMRCNADSQQCINAYDDDPIDPTPHPPTPPTPPLYPTCALRRLPKQHAHRHQPLLHGDAEAVGARGSAPRRLLQTVLCICVLQLHRADAAKVVEVSAWGAGQQARTSIRGRNQRSWTCERHRHGRGHPPVRPAKSYKTMQKNVNTTLPHLQCCCEVRKASGRCAFARSASAWS